MPVARTVQREAFGDDDRRLRAYRYIAILDRVFPQNWSIFSKTVIYGVSKEIGDGGKEQMEELQRTKIRGCADRSKSRATALRTLMIVICTESLRRRILIFSPALK
jgi:hypothetical protein